MLRTGSQALETLTIRGSVKRIGGSALNSDMPYDTPISTANDPYYASNGYDAGVNHAVRLILEEGVESIGGFAFYHCGMFTSIELPSTLREIGNDAFSNCTAEMRLSLGGVETISDYAFYQCTGLKELDLDGVKTIGELAFAGCTGLQSLYIPDSVTKLAVGGAYRGPFYNCTGLRDISVGGVETLTNGMLRTGSQALETLTIRGSVKRIGGFALESYLPYDTPYSTANDPYYASNGYDAGGNHAVRLILEEGV